MGSLIDRLATSGPARASIALLTMAVLVAPFTAPAGAQTCTNSSFDPATQWDTIAAPEFSKGEQAITAHAVDPLDPRKIYITNGSVVAITADTGCKWTETYGGPEGPGAPTAYVIQEIHVPGPHTAILRIHETAPVSRPRIEVSTSGGENWRTGGAGLAAGEPEFLDSAQKSPNPLYLGIDVGGGALDLIYASSDSGETWVLQSNVAETRALAGIIDIEVDPIDPQLVWAFGPGGLYRSQNGARSFEAIPEFADAGRVGPVDVFHEPGAPPYIMAFRPEEERLGVSRDGERWLFGNQTPPDIDAADHGVGAGEVFVSASTGVHKYHEKSQGWPNLDAPSGARAVIATQTPTLMLTARSSSAIFRLVPRPGPGGPDGFLDEDPDISLVQPPEVIARESSIFPDDKKIRIPVGESKKVEYTVNMPERPRPLDVFFLVDTSSSMTRTINGLAVGLQDIVNELAKEGIDVNFGLAEYRTYPTSNPPKSARNEKDASFVYKRKVDIQEDVSALADAIEDLEANGGGHYDAHLGALKQVVTGEGQDLFPVGVDNEEDVDPGQQASFRDKAIRVVINATDEKFGRQDGDGGPANVLPDDGPPRPDQAPPPNIPSFEEVISLLNSKLIKQVGLSIGYLPFKDLTRVADETGTVAFGEGVDCDGNGSIEIRLTEPLVCQLRSSTTSEAINLVPAVVNLLKSVQDPVPVQLEAVEGQEVVEKIGPDGYENVILQSQNKLTFDVEFACANRQGGERFPVTLQADSTVDLSALRVDALVVCTEEKDPKDEVLPVSPLAAPLIALAVPPAPPLPPTVTELSSATQTQAQSQAQAQGAAAQQEQQEPQLAYVAASGLEDEETLELNMTAYSERREIPASALMGMGTVALSMMFGAAMVRQRTQARTRAQRQGR